MANKARSRLSMDDAEVLNHAESFRSYTHSQETLSKVFDTSGSTRSLLEQKFMRTMMTYKRSIDIGMFKGEGNLNATVNDYVDTWGFHFMLEKQQSGCLIKLRMFYTETELINATERVLRNA